MTALLMRAAAICAGWYDAATWSALTPAGRERAFARALRVARTS